MIIEKKESISFAKDDPFNSEIFAQKLAQMIGYKRRVLFLCIGTDRSTGDSLGPLIGHQLETVVTEEALVVGTLKQPVHAMNLENVLEGIDALNPRPCVVAIDAALGKPSSIGQITLSKQPLAPGLGVKKKLPQVGEISITGTIGSYSLSDAESIQSIRLSLIMDMAERISSGIKSYCYGKH